MVSRYEVTLNGISLESIHPNILLMDVEYAEPKYELRKFTVVKRPGARIYDHYKEKASVAITFQIREYDIAKRQEICQSINKWAKDGGDLRINDRPGQRLMCICEKFPAITSVRGWTEDLSIEFAAYAIPYWQDIEPHIFTAEYPAVVEYGANGGIREYEMYVPGSAPFTYLEFELTDADFSSEHSYTIEVQSDIMNDPFALNGAQHHADEFMYALYYDQNMVMSLKQYYPDGQETKTASMMHYLTKPNDIVVPCGGTQKIKFANRRLSNSQTDEYTTLACSIKFMARGLWE